MTGQFTTTLTETTRQFSSVDNISEAVHSCQDLQDYLGFPLGFAGGLLRDAMCGAAPSAIQAYCWQLTYGKLGRVLNLLTDFSGEPVICDLIRLGPSKRYPSYAFNFNWRGRPVTIYQFPLPGSLHHSFDFFQHLVYQQPIGLNRIGYYQGVLATAPEFFLDQFQQQLTYYRTIDESAELAQELLLYLQAQYPQYTRWINSPLPPLCHS